MKTLNGIALNPAERLLVITLLATWPLYVLGALYIVGPVLGWSLAIYTAISLYLGPAMRSDSRAITPIPAVVWAWVIGMMVMLVALWVGHLDWGLGLGKTIKSTIGWAKGWALIALFPLVGACLPIRRATIVRAHCMVAACTLALLVILLPAPYVGLPGTIYTSPLKAVGGPGPEYFTLYLYTIDPESHTARWQFYAPWSPFAGLLGVMMVLFALEETNRRWLTIGVLAGLAMVVLSASRMSLVAIIVCTVLPRCMPLLLRGWAWQLAAGAVTSLAVLGAPILAMINDGIAAFKGSRAGSTRVRATLQRIAHERWQTEAIWFGHGTVEPGPHLVEYMPIGSHHTWYGLLFVKGVTGFAAFLVPLIWQFSLALIDATRSPRGRLPLGLMLTLVMLTFGENIEIQAYLIWPTLLMLGIHAREMRVAGQRS